MDASERQKPSESKSVILLHGILRSKRSMASLARTLERFGYRVLNIDYKSRGSTISDIAESVHAEIAHFSKGSNGVHMVGHSMGGLVIREYLHHYPNTPIQRVVMLGTPNHGSEVADFLQNNRLYRWLYGPAGQELCTYHTRPQPTKGDVGIIAGNVSFDPISSAIIGKPNDGKVSIESTKLENMQEHIILPASHSFMPQNKQVQRAVVNFLTHGSFSPKS